MKLSTPSELELQDVLSVVVEQRNGVSTGQERENIFAWIVENLFPTKSTLLLFSRSFVNFKN
jgi:hypothetical protein